MEKLDHLEEIIDVDALIEKGSKLGYLTQSEVDVICEASTNVDTDDLLDYLSNLDIDVIDEDVSEVIDEVVKKETKKKKVGGNGNGKVENRNHGDLIGYYFQDMGPVSILTKKEEIELAKKIQSGNDAIWEIIRKMPLVKRTKKEIESSKKKDDRKKEDVVAATREIVIDKIQQCVAKVNDPKEKRAIEAMLGIKISYLANLWRQISKEQKIISEAKNELITHNLKLVVNIAKGYVGRGLDLPDLVQEGNFGLMKAVDRFKYKKGFKFSTYATWWIWQAIGRGLINQKSTIRIPVHKATHYNKIIKIERELTQELEREPSIEEIAQKGNFSPNEVQKIRDIFQATQGELSLNVFVGIDENTEIIDLIQDKNAASPLSDVIQSDMNKSIEKALKLLTPKQEGVIRRRFGIGFDRDYTLDEIGREMSVTRERIRQIEFAAMRKLRNVSIRKNLGEFLYKG